jgi:hypothetical protein
VLNTEEIDDPFHEVPVGDKVIVGGRAVHVYCDDGVDVTVGKRPTRTL